MSLLVSNSPTQLADTVPAETSKPVTTPTSQAEAHAQLNTAIVQASIDVAISSQNEPLALLFKTAIAGINDILKPAFGENAIENAATQDNTPEGTAGRIVSLSTGFFEAFKKQFAGTAEEALSKFMTTLHSGVDQGFKEARGILDGMQVLKGSVADNIDKTYQLVQQGYADFEAAQRSAAAPAVVPAAAGTTLEVAGVVNP